jgi:excisionase family DNA binding protein
LPRKEVGNINLLTPQEVSELFKIPIVQVQKLAREGKIPAGKVGRLWRFREKDVWRWFESTYYKTPDMAEIYERVREIVDNANRT